MDTFVLKAFISSFALFLILQLMVNFLIPRWAKKFFILFFLISTAQLLVITRPYDIRVLGLSLLLLSLGIFAYTFCIRAFQQSMSVRLIALLDSPQGKTLEDLTHVQ